MPITITDDTQIRITHGFGNFTEDHGLPTPVLSVAKARPGPLAIDAAGAITGSGQAQVKPALGDAGRAAYIGYTERKGAIGEPCCPVSGVVVDGFSGVTPGGAVYIDDTGSEAASPASGLTHTAPTTGTNKNPIGIGWTATKIYFFRL